MHALPCLDAQRLRNHTMEEDQASIASSLIASELPAEGRIHANLFSAQKLQAFETWCKHLAFVESFNAAKVPNGPKLAMNALADLSPAEYAERRGWTGWQHAKTSTPYPYTDVSAPDEVDWRSAGAVTNVKDQGQCGMMPAFGLACIALT